MGQLISQFDEEPTEHSNWPDYSNWGEFREMKHHVWLPEQDREARQNYKGTDVTIMFDMFHGKKIRPL